MTLAVIAVTAQGARLAQRIQENLACDIYVKAGRHSLANVQEYSSLASLVKQIFAKYDGLIFIMATGIVVRVIAPYIVHKEYDPAVVVLDERGKHVISLLSGHIGGANALAQSVAVQIDATPVITTATDVNDKIAVDMIAVTLGLMIEPFPQLKYINAEIVQGEIVLFFIDAAMRDANIYQEHLKAMDIEAELMNLPIGQALPHASVLITDQVQLKAMDRQVLLKPRKLSVGIGCRRGTSEAEIMQAITSACKMAGKSPQDIARIASTTLKQDEQGLLAAAKTFHVDAEFYKNNELQEMIEKYNLDRSRFVEEKIGVGNVCEAAAILASQSKKIILPKMKFNKVTVAIAWDK